MDSTIHVWSIQRLLSFSAIQDDATKQDVRFSPVRSLTNHRAAITAIVVGHSFGRSNIAVSASKDNTCIVWEYSSGDLLHLYLLAASPFCLALDPADRAAYAGYEDGSIQFLDFYSKGGTTQQLYDPVAKSTPTQPALNTRWPALEEPGSAILSLQVTYDGTGLLSGHQDGKIHAWDVATSRYDKQVVDFSAPIANLHMLKPTGFTNTKKPPLILHNVVKPRYETFANGQNGNSGTVPSNYAFTAQFAMNIPFHGCSNVDSFHEAIAQPSFPPSLLDDAVAEFTAWQSQVKAIPDSSDLADLRARNGALSSQLEAAMEGQRTALAEVQQRDKQAWRRQKDEEVKALKKKRRRLRRIKLSEMSRKKEMGESLNDEDEDMDGGPEDEDELSSSTDELTDNA